MEKNSSKNSRNIILYLSFCGFAGFCGVNKAYFNLLFTQQFFIKCGALFVIAPAIASDFENYFPVYRFF
ncbi:MAG: hypothetical protein PHQ96_02035, partial [Candidatus Omnitrophica bacterium]|nr:hypothetical protein [Candidatus Omnitrophota bacterium]